MLNRNRLILLTMLLLTALALWLKAPVAGSQGLTITAARVEGALPVAAPDDPLWQQATAVEVPLSAQMVAKPMWPSPSIKSVTVRALHNGKELAMLLEWADDTRNDSSLRVDEFRDSVAVQFPLIEGQPFFCMGQQAGNVNIWHWKADWQAALLARQSLQDAYPNIHVDYYPFAEAQENIYLAAYTDVDYLTAEAVGNLLALPVPSTPVEDMVAGGFGTLTSQPAEAQNVQGYGVWQEGVWRVVFSRSLRSDQADDAALAPDKLHAVAFAAWDGANGERNGAKSTSQWVSLQLGAAAAAAPAEEVAAPVGAPAAAPERAVPPTNTALVLVFVGLLALAVVAGAIYLLTLEK
ncbi:MAG: ethylbenzene dehydrogenase-related protein [Caldilineales bacterium]|nr:ethylbenzene dehydrogenase-related protein [Caldilineales bacterium]MDW8319429.1 ethylbenzene dehydrogenase-related protein [Anaerolineae bacterium]